MSSQIRNFAIIAHIDHGKSTLADRLLELTGVVENGKHEEQMLDRNPISRERGITIKLAPVRMEYKSKVHKVIKSIKHNTFDFADFKDFETNYVLNLIDTPGHVDFSYEVDRTLACVEGVILLVDATQGIQAQTISNAHKAVEKNLVVIPVVNKIDLPNADIKGTRKQLADFLGMEEDEVFLISAKTGEGVGEVLQAVILKIPNPNFQFPGKFQISNKQISNISALIFDSYYDSHRGVIAFVRVFQGKIKKGDKAKLAAISRSFEVTDVGHFMPELKAGNSLETGEIGYVVTNLKDVHDVRVGDTITAAGTDNAPALPGYKKIKPMVFASIFPTDSNEYLSLKKALEKLYLNDSSLEFSALHSKALGTGFRIGFLGLLHADVVRERLEREFGLNLVLTPPQVEYQFDYGRDANGKKGFKEPYVKIMIITPQTYIGQVMQLCEHYRGEFITMDNVGNADLRSLQIQYEMPMPEMVSDFYDRLKSVSSGYASLDWEFVEYRQVDADKLTLLLNSDPIDEFSEIVVKERSMEKAQSLVKKLGEFIPRQQFEVKIQAQYRGKIIASERIAPFRKDVTKKLYGGDRTRKDKLLDKQKEGKKKMKMIGRVEIPKEAFLKLFKK